MRTIQAIPTTYKGITFRSRLEARWAIYFETLGLEWHYEFEGYQLGDCWYVPDFWLPKVGWKGTFVEVKPTREVAGADDRIFRLAGEAGVDTLLVWSNPVVFPEGQGYEIARAYETVDGEPEYGWDNCHYFCGCSNCDRVGLAYCADANRLCLQGCLPTRRLNSWAKMEEQAVEAARAARFH